MFLQCRDIIPFAKHYYITIRLRFLRFFNIFSLVKSIIVSRNCCDVQPSNREREASLRLEPVSFSYFERRGTLVCYGCAQERDFDEYLHYPLSEALRQGRYMEKIGTDQVRDSFESSYQNAHERRCRQCAGLSSRKYYAGIRGNGTLASDFLELPTELLLHVFDFLDLLSVLRLTGTKSYLKSFCTRHRL